MASKKPQLKDKKQAQAAKHIPKQAAKHVAKKIAKQNPKAAAKASKAAPAKARSAPAKEKATPTHHLAARIAALLGVNVEQALERAVHELAEKLGMHKIADATAPHYAAVEEVKAAAAAHAPAKTDGAAKPAAKSETKPAAKAPRNDVIPAKALDTTPLPTRTMSLASSTGVSSALPRRLYLALDGRGLDGGGMPIEIINTPVTMGSGRRNTIWINQPRIETTHAQIVESDDGWVYEDLGSEHGTYLHDERIERVAIQDGDTFLLANYLRVKAILK